MKKSFAADSGPGHRAVEIGVGLATAAFGILVIFGSIKAGTGWGAEGPRAGFFPFYIGIFILLASVVNLVTAFIEVPKDKLFAEWGQLARVVSVIIPTAVFVGLVPTLGIYVPSAMLIALFMKWLGKYRWSIVAAVSIGVPIANFLVFEKWFLVSLPKGPLETMLGF